MVAGDAAASVMIVLKGREQENLGQGPGPRGGDTGAGRVLGHRLVGDGGARSPYFALIATADERVVGAGSAQSWGQLRSLATDGMLEVTFADRASSNGRDG